MSEPTLDPEELEAIQAAVRAGRPRASAPPALDARDAARLTLLAGERLAERAIPALLRLGTRWASDAPRGLAAHLPGTWRAAPLGCEVVTGTALRELQRSAWITAGAVAAGSTLALAVEGEVIQRAAARRCGDAGKPPSAERPTPPITAAAIRLFEPTGRAIAASWEQTWRALVGRNDSVAASLARWGAGRYGASGSGESTCVVAVGPPPGRRHWLRMRTCWAATPTTISRSPAASHTTWTLPIERCATTSMDGPNDTFVRRRRKSHATTATPARPTIATSCTGRPWSVPRPAPPTPRTSVGRAAALVVDDGAALPRSASASGPAAEPATRPAAASVAGTAEFAAALPLPALPVSTLPLPALPLPALPLALSALGVVVAVALARGERHPAPARARLQPGGPGPGGARGHRRRR